MTFSWEVVTGLSDVRTPTRMALGAITWSSSTYFADRSRPKSVRPVILPPGARKARDNPGAYGVGHAHHDDGNRRRFPLGGQRPDRGLGDDDVGFQRDELGGKARKSFVLPFPAANIDDEVFSLDVAEIM